MDIVYLRITSYAGIVSVAQHYYGTLQCGSDEVDLTHPMTAQDVARFNRTDPDFNWKVGAKTNRFCRELELKQLAIKEYRKHFPNAGLLIKGKPAYAEPQPILDGPEDVKARACVLSERAEANRWWSGDSEAMFAICDEWDALLEEVKEREAPVE